MKLLLPPDLKGHRNEIQTPGRQMLIIGANGAGKTRFTDFLIEEYSEKAFRLSALEALYGPKDKRNPLPGSIDSLYQAMVEHQPIFNASIPLMLDRLLALLLNDEIQNLLTQKVAAAGRSGSGERKGKVKLTKLDRVIKAWQSIFPANRILVDGGKLQFTRDDRGQRYSSIRLSDGERATLFYLGAVLYAPDHAKIFIDNPGMFLHPTVSTVIWNKVEGMRPDCTFIYTTHDLEFASSRSDYAVVWVRDFDPALSRWDYSLLPEHSGIPEDVYLSIIGSRKPVLFIEGVAERSIDYKLYPLIFPEFSVKALGSCNKVIESVRTFNDLNAFHHLNSYGIVDRDRRDPKEVEYLRRKKVLVPDVAEVENLLLLEEVIKAVARHCRKDADKVFAKVKNTMMKIFKGSLTAQALQHTRHRVKRTMEYRIDGRFRDIEMLEEHMMDLVNEINPRGIYETMCRDFRRLLEQQDYPGILRVYNEKTMLTNTNVAALCGLKNKDQYLTTILTILKENGNEATAIRDAIAGAFGVNRGEINSPETRAQ